MPKRYKYTKECTKCKEIKPYEDFYKCAGYFDGYKYLCKRCDLKNRKRRHEANRESENERYREYYRKNKERILKRQSGYVKSGRKTYKADRTKNLARMQLRYAVKIGAIEKTPCIVCGDKLSQGHHQDYSKPLEVVWLCSKHHAEVHRGALNLPPLTTNK